MNLLLVVLFPLTVGFLLNGRQREVDVQEMVMKATMLMSRVRGMKNFGEIMNLLSRLNKINTTQFSFLGNSQHKTNDHELVDIANKINNILRQMTSMSDDEIARGKGFGALVLASNQLNTYLKKHQPAWIKFVPDFDFTDPGKGFTDFSKGIPGFDGSVPFPNPGNSFNTFATAGGFNMPFFG